MAKLTILLASFIALLFLVDASIYRTNIIIEADDDDAETQNDHKVSCQDQIQRLQKLRRCQEYIRQEVDSSRRDNDNPLAEIRECCNQLKRLETHCRCDGLRQAIQQQQKEGLKGEDVRQAYRIASDLPSECGVSPSLCQFRQPREWF